MMWPFRSSRDAEVIRNLKQDRDQWEDAYRDLEESQAALIQARGAAETSLANIRRALTAEGVAEIASKATAQIADIYASGAGGVVQRDIWVHAVVAAAIRIATEGERHWNEGALAQEFYRGKQ